MTHLLKKIKGLFRDLFEEWSLNAPTNPKTGHPLAPSCQLLAQWIVKAWAKVPKELVRKLWGFCGYKSTEDLSNEEETASVAVINYSQEQLGTMIENIAGDDAIMAWIDEVIVYWIVMKNKSSELTRLDCVGI